MSDEIFRTVEEPLSASDGMSYTARICGRAMDDTRWEGWIEYVPEAGAPVLRSRRETTQTNRGSLRGWAARLSGVYLEGSLERTLSMEGQRAFRPAAGRRRPYFDGPAPERGDAVAPDDAALNPFLGYRAGSDELLRRLRRLSASELRTVVRAYGLEQHAPRPLEALTAEELVVVVMDAVIERMGT